MLIEPRLDEPVEFLELVFGALRLPSFPPGRDAQQKNLAAGGWFRNGIRISVIGFPSLLLSQTSCLELANRESPRVQHDSRGHRCSPTRPLVSRASMPS